MFFLLIYNPKSVIIVMILHLIGRQPDLYFLRAVSNQTLLCLCTLHLNLTLAGLPYSLTKSNTKVFNVIRRNEINNDSMRTS